MGNTKVKRTIAIVLGDNDFGNTFYNLLNTMKNVIEYSTDENGEVSRGLIEMAIREGIRFHYMAFQNQGRYNADVARTVKYLDDNIRILFDEEAEKDILDGDHDHGAWHMNLFEMKVYSY